MSKPDTTPNSPIRARLKLEGGGTIKVYDDSVVTCGVHGTERKWKDLDCMQQLCVEDNICVSEGLRCLIAKPETAE